MKQQFLRSWTSNKEEISFMMGEPNEMIPTIVPVDCLENFHVAMDE